MRPAPRCGVDLHPVGTGKELGQSVGTQHVEPLREAFLHFELEGVIGRIASVLIGPMKRTAILRVG